MNKLFSICIKQLSGLIFLVLLISSVSVSVFGQNSPQKTTKPAGFLSKNEHQVLASIQKAIDQDQLALGIKKIEQLSANKASPLAIALAQQLLGIIYQAQLDYPKALAAYERAISYRQLPRASKVKLFEKIHKLNYFLKDWQQVVHWWLKWEKRAKPQAQDYLLLSSAYRYQKQWGKAKNALLKGMAIAQKPPQLWYQLLLEYEEQLQSKSGQEKLLKQLIERHPANESYWLKLAKLYTASGREQQASALLFSAFSAQVLTKASSVKWLVESLAAQHNYMRAVAVLDTALSKNVLTNQPSIEHQAIDYLMRAKSYQQALARVQKNLARNPSFQGNAVLAKIYFALKRWPQAYQLAQKLPRKAVIADIQWQLLLGISSANLGEKAVAKKHLLNVLELEENNALAKFWIAQL